MGTKQQLDIDVHNHIMQLEAALLESDNKLSRSFTEIPDFIILDAITHSGNDVAKVTFIARWLKENWAKFEIAQKHFIRIRVIQAMKMADSDGWEETIKQWQSIVDLPESIFDQKPKQ